MGISFACIAADGTLEASYGPAQPVYSITKTWIASLIGDSRIDLAHPIAHWVSQAECSHAENITIRQLLNHSSGLRDYGQLPDYQVAVAQRLSPWSDQEFAAQTTCQPPGQILEKPPLCPGADAGTRG